VTEARIYKKWRLARVGQQIPSDTSLKACRAITGFTSRLTNYLQNPPVGGL
jgi:hypothetical protein